MLKIEDLVVAFKTEYGELTAVKGVSLSLQHGETLALVGESGCGKTVLCKSMLKILCEKGNIKRGEILLDGQDLVPLQEEEMIPYRGSEVAMIFQDPMTSLDPTMSVGDQIAEMIKLADERSGVSKPVERDGFATVSKSVEHDGASTVSKSVERNGSAIASNRAKNAEKMNLSYHAERDGASTASNFVERAPYPVEKKTPKERAIELMRMVEIDSPELRYGQMPHHFSGGMRQRIAIAIALAGRPRLLLADEPTTALDQQTQAQILALLKKIDITTIFITHDLSLVEDIADRVAIMKDGEIVETGSVSDVFENPQHQYTKKLLGYLDYGKGRGHSHKHTETKFTEPLVEIRGLKKYFSLGSRSFFNRDTKNGENAALRVNNRADSNVEQGAGKNEPYSSFIHKAIDGLDLNIYKGEILGIVGPSGCGKSTLARCIMEMLPLTAGEIKFHNSNKNKNWKQMIFQDSASAFNPRMTIGQIIGEPLRIATGRKPSKEKILDLMEQVELGEELIDRHPYEISGGQRQRAAIARAISVDPELIIADEPISSLDISTQAQIVHLFRKLQEKRNLTIVFIAHDLPMVNHISDRIIEMN